jgi:hypothetical protein
MPCANEKYFSKEHIESHALNASFVLAEQAIHCLELVAELSWANLSFQFKGGNSLLIILKEPKRFSIDVDIATDEDISRIEEILNKIVEECGVFIKWTKRTHKTKPWLPLSCYYLFYKSLYAKEEDSFIMLDAQLTRSPYETREIPISCKDFFKTIIKAEVPLESSIIGDKILTLGPNTLGIPLGKQKEAQRLKHIFDISLLLETKPSLTKIRESFVACVNHENKLQNKNITANQILADTLLLCKSVLEYKTMPKSDMHISPLCKEHLAGLNDFASHLFFKGYDWEYLRKDAAMVGLCIASICNLDINDEMFISYLEEYKNDAEKVWQQALTFVKEEG